MTSKRISMSLFDDELKSLINASAKIFPVSEYDIENNINPNNYEYAKVGRKIYIWINDKWEYVIADDVEVLWTDIQEKPLSFNSSPHNHSESEIVDLDKYNKSEVDTKLSSKSDKTHSHTDLHSHINKSILDLITQNLINTWNTVTGKSDINHLHDDRYYTELEINDLIFNKSDKNHIHVESDISDLNKYTKEEIDAKLLNKSDSAHNHDGAYYKKSEIDIKLVNKEDKFSNRSVLSKITESISNDSYDLDMLYDLDERLYLIEGGYSEGHSHSNLSVLESITQTLVNGWNNAVSHITDAIKHITSSERTLWNTVSNKSDLNHTHSYAPVVHSHDDRYYLESEMDIMMSGKADATTLSGHTGNTVMHVTQIDKNNWNGKQDSIGYVPVNTLDSRLSDARVPLKHTHVKSDITDFPSIPGKTSDLVNDSGYITINNIPEIPPSFSLGTVKPTDGSLWLKEI